MRELTIKIHDVATDGLPDMDTTVGRVAFIFDGCVVSGWPLDEAEHEQLYRDTRARLTRGEHCGGAGETLAAKRASAVQLWEGDSDVSRGGVFCGVTHWIEFPVPLSEIERSSPLIEPLPTPDLPELDRAMAIIAERAAQGLPTRLVADGEVIGVIRPPKIARDSQ